MYPNPTFQVCVVVSCCKGLPTGLCFARQPGIQRRNIERQCSVNSCTSLPILLLFMFVVNQYHNTNNNVSMVSTDMNIKQSDARAVRETAATSWMS